MCGIIGIYGHPEASTIAYLGLYALQHRGQESSWIVASDEKVITFHKERGLVSDVFSQPEIFSRLKGNIAIGHNRYSTTGADAPVNVQPFIVNCGEGPIGICHNGNLVNLDSLRDYLINEGAIFQTSTDSEAIVHLIAHSREKGMINKIKDALRQIKGAFSIIFLTKDKIIAARDPKGWRPLCIGSMDGALVSASESCTFDLIGAKYIRDVLPGELVVLDENGITSEIIFEREKTAHCIFEFIYFSRPDSIVFGEYVDKARRKLGKNLAKEHPIDADIVFAIPDSSNTAALGFSHESGVKFEHGLIRNHYIGRTFIHPVQELRDFKVKIKFNTIGGVIKDKRVVVVDDSIVRGTTMKKLVRLIKNAGAKEVHVRISSHPIRYPCFYGIDFPTSKELIAYGREIQEIQDYLKVDSLGYLSLEGMLNSVPRNECSNYCTACFSGEYPIQVVESARKNQFELPLFDPSES